MNLPEYERVIYRKNPLLEVIAQLRFPAILKIADGEPADFQDAIRSDYPGFESERLHQDGLPPEVASLMKKAGVEVTGKTFFFISEDSQWKIGLTKDFISISTLKYERYEEFSRKFKSVINAFEEIYQPSYYSRVGLRYKDLILKSRFEKQSVGWEDFIPSHVSPEFHSQEIRDDIKGVTKVSEYSTGFGSLKMQHGLVAYKDSEANTTEDAYIFDFDFFTEDRTTREAIWEFLDKSNKLGGRFFRWSITNELHEAMEPMPAGVLK